MGRKLGGGALWGLPPLGACTHQLTHASYSAGNPVKNDFCLGRIGPHLGEIWGFEIWLLANFGLLLLGTLSTDFRFFDGVRQPRAFSNDAENFVKIKFVEFEQWGSKFGVWGIFGFWARTPHLTTDFYSPCDLDKNGFCLGESAPFGGDMGVSNLAFFGFLAYFGLLLLGTLSTDFRFFAMLKISRKLNSTISSNVRSKLATSPSRLCNGAMVTAPVRDRPPNVLGVE